MQDRDFEKQVQQKMQELRFAPGADVWARVQADIQKKKRRRPVVLWLLFAALLIGSSWLLYTVIQTDNKIAASDKQTSATDENSEQNRNVTDPQIQKPSTEPSGGQGSLQPENKPEKSVQTESVVSPVVTEGNKNIEQGEKTVQKSQPAERSNIKSSNAPSTKAVYHKTKSGIDKGDRGKTQNRFVQSNKPLATQKKNNLLPSQVNPETDIKQAEKIIEKPIVQKGEDLTQDAGKPGLTPLNNPVSKVADVSTAVPDKIANGEVQPKDSLSSQPSTVIAMKNNSVKKKAGTESDWQIGISGGAGMSDLGNELFQGTSVADLAYGGGAVTPAAPPIQRASEVQAGLAFNFGGYVSKGFARKLRLKLGLEYDYYSNDINTGSYVNSTRVVNQGTALNLVNEFYSAGNTNKFTNRYHFISIPVSLQWQINNSSKLGLTWENGISPARMIYTNALHYDGISGTYYEEDNLFRKTQWIASSSFLFSIKTKNNLQLYAGPQVQYGLSNMVDNAEKNKHLRYAGIKMMVGLNK